MICAAAAIFAVACAEEMEGPSSEGLERRSFVSIADGDMTRTSLSADYNVVWSQGDAISVFAGGENKKFSVSNLRDDNKVATFEGVSSFAEKYYALYPYDENASFTGETITASLPSVQPAAAGTFADGMNLSAGKTSTEEIQFRNIGGIIGITVNAEGVTGIKLSCSDMSAVMTGKVNIDMSGDIPEAEAVEGYNYVKLEGQFESGEKYYFTVLPGTYEGLELLFEAAGSEAVFAKRTEASVTVGRNSHKYLGEFTITDEDWVKSEYRSYVLNGKEEVDRFVAEKGEEKEIVQDLTITGRGVCTDELIGVYSRVGTIRGTLTLDGIGTESETEWIDTNNIIEHVDCQGSIILRNILNIINPNGFKNRPVKVVNGDLVIENCPHFVVSWGAGTGIDCIEEVKGDFVLKGVRENNGIDGSTLNSLRRVGGRFELSDNTNMWSLKEGMSIEYIGGDLVIQDNPSLWSLHGFENLTYVGGNVIIMDNHPKMPLSNQNVDGSDCLGFCMIRDYREMGVVSRTAAVRLGWTDNEIDVDTIPSCFPDRPASYVLNGEEAVRSFIDGRAEEREVVWDLYVSGADVAEQSVRDLKLRVKEIQGTLTLAELGTSDSWISTSEFLEPWNVNLAGNLVMKNIPAHINPNGTQKYEKITGDITIENCPQFPNDWDPFTELREITGSISITGPVKGFGERFFPNIVKIGGDFILRGIDGFWDFKSETLREIGGDLVIDECPVFCRDSKGLYGFHQLTRLGGNVYINIPSVWLPENNYGADKVGLCIFKGYKESGAMDAGSSITAIGAGGQIDIESLASCGGAFEQ